MYYNAKTFAKYVLLLGLSYVFLVKFCAASLL